MEHIPVLLNEVLEFFQYLKDNSEFKVICDFTVGGGGHSEAILKNFKNVKIYAFDKDEFAIEYSKERLKKFDKRIEFINSDYSDFDNFIDFKINGAILDLGVSTFQILDEKRGFSFLSNSKLDMRMNTKSNLSAYEVVNKYNFLELQRIFKEYGDIRMPNRVIKSIINYRKKKPIETCNELAEIILKCTGKRGKIHAATKYFQAIRIEVNNELESLREFLEKIIEFMKKGSRLQIISFHSLEDRIVKHFFKEKENVKILTKRPIIPSKEEKLSNPKSRSAKLRVIEFL